MKGRFALGQIGPDAGHFGPDFGHGEEQLGDRQIEGVGGGESGARLLDLFVDGVFQCDSQAFSLRFGDTGADEDATEAKTGECHVGMVADWGWRIPLSSRCAQRG